MRLLGVRGVNGGSSAQSLPAWLLMASCWWLEAEAQMPLASYRVPPGTEGALPGRACRAGGGGWSGSSVGERT